MRIIYIASEAFPFIKTGGLADVMYALPKQMSEMGHKVSVIIPKYDKINMKYLKDIKFVDSIDMNYDRYNLVKYEDENIEYLFIENMSLFERGHIYGDNDDDIRYANFCEVALRFIRKLEMRADIIHCNDWQTGLLPYFLKKRYKTDPFFYDFRVVYTIHNLMYQGRYNSYAIKNLGYDINEEYVNFMKIGIEYADVVNTVSPTYAGEINYPYFAEGLEDTIKSRKIFGILNGIDYTVYDPRNNKSFAPLEDNKYLEFKEKNKELLLEKFNLKNSNNLTISVISRMVEGKGFDLIIDKIEEILRYDSVNILILGVGDYKYESIFNNLCIKYPDKFRVYIGYSEELANLMYAGSDLFLMPSRYEPCGLSQMIAMRYGAIPLVRETGGLKDSVTAYNMQTNEGNGFSFTNFNADDMLNVIRYSEHIFFDRKDIWNKLVEKNFNIDNSWTRSAKEYYNLYMFAKTTP
ncbi:glycogen synthase [Oceanivirga miroungae]|uniref:Glycogen synthase n=1 Tax=Oceanivirga miroungae TaxID=1130046 RepID=A0A6I8M831_9FUSO|nr:glycogen synthase [Oceanivirga miroungae]VWL85589.1 glycogen/starch synthase [Oceanivirga miroungae]